MAYWVNGTQKEYENPEEGLHDAVLCDVVPLGTQDTAFGPKKMVKLRWQLDTVNSQNKRFLVSQRYTSSIHPKSKLGQHLETWRGRRFTDDERANFDLETLLGVNCQVQIVHSPGKQGSMWANVNAVLPPTKNPATKKPWWNKLAAIDYVREQDRPKEQHVGAVAVEHDPFAAKGAPEPEYVSTPDDDDVPF